MSILSNAEKLAAAAFSGQISWNAAAAQVDSQLEAWVAKDPTVAGLANAAGTEIKQGLSVAIGTVTSGLAANQTNIAQATEAALEAELAAITGGESRPLDKFISDGVDRLVAAAVVAAQAFGLKAKATLAAA